ncbi:hypothetical protein M0813_21243 [Anaeramoeba flamelloides]|uniref:Uncharacterized protein n=1 Tax=Anaeramoeba flamelloides TaxID=1746091 RepID=A0ABQ8YIG7_9EUKA|nr:hypothetical protein M0813_21243 [Anaeramoeba flamelloides]
MTNILGFGGNFGYWRQPKDNFSPKPESLAILPEEVTQIVDVISIYNNIIVFLSSEVNAVATRDNLVFFLVFSFTKTSYLWCFLRS